ncbi:ATP-binding cassette domain-containing protein [Parachryseolinea silvisoli]|jgi:ABC-type branched-subunit amino acid transport system ATPase component|uniref:ATP-binding cassette domain-containing protein n=1 Tax=Parachryseolinea silvisoli TaxID=2873601 RepID=UPI002265ACE2|nr:ATP-binding cassette domain-containing protein [Parachryseolinea silvisoli]MCD9019263.1 ATP-binding cassette domain-containing protein [Parachryseolinea silvisoli]
MSDLLEFDGIELSYGPQRILSGIYMKCPVGSITGILGRNGCGKSSLLKVVFGSLPVPVRSVRINGQYLAGDYMKKRIIAYLPQEDLIPANMQLQQALRLFAVDPRSILEYFPEAERFLPLRSRELSGGYRRIIEAMMVLHSRATFCLLDEPFTGVMPVHVDTLRYVLTKAKERKGIILTDHLYRQVLSVADHLYVLSDGRTFAIKDHEDLVTRGYIHTMD